MIDQCIFYIKTFIFSVCTVGGFGESACRETAVCVLKGPFALNNTRVTNMATLASACRWRDESLMLAVRDPGPWRTTLQNRKSDPIAGIAPKNLATL